MAQNSVKPFILSVFASASVAAGYKPVNANGFLQAPFFIRINNASNMPITVSYDGINDHEYIPSTSIFELSSQANAQPNAQISLFPKFTVVYVKGTAGTGNIYLSGYYV